MLPKAGGILTMSVNNRTEDLLCQHPMSKVSHIATSMETSRKQGTLAGAKFNKQAHLKSGKVDD